MDKKFIHIKFPNEFFDGDEYDRQARLDLLKGLQEKIESSGEPGQYCVFATPFDVACLNDSQALITIDELLSTVFIQEHLRDGLKMLLSRVMKQIEDTSSKPADDVQTPVTIDEVKIPFDTFKHPICKGAFSLGSACGHCEKCRWLKANTKIDCRHRKVYADYALESYPPQYPWICATCGEQGNDSEKIYSLGIPNMSYDQLKRQFKKQ